MIIQNCASFIPSFVPSFVPVRKSSWQHEVTQSDLPVGTKGFLALLSIEWMDANGGSCFPSEAQIMEKLGMSRPAVTGHIRRAVAGGFLEVQHYGRGIRNRRYNYQARFPGEDRKESFVSPPEDGKESFASLLTMPNVNHVQERAAPEPAPVAPAPVTPLSTPVLRTEQPRTSRTGLTEDWTLPDHFRQIAQELRPDLADRLDTIAAIFRDHHLSRATKSAHWIGEWRIWLNREKPLNTPKSASKPFKTETMPSPYANWQNGQKAPIGATLTHESLMAGFERDMRAAGAVQQPDGTWLQPAAPSIPVPATEPVNSEPPPALPIPSGRERLLAQTAKLEELYRQGGREAVLGLRNPDL